MLESLKEYFSSTINTAAQRVSNPVFGAFSLSWCAFNWKSILYLFLSNSGIIDKITYISDNSSWKTVALYPCFSVAVLCGCLPWINNMISVWQAKPLDNNDSIENYRKAKRIFRATRLQRLQAKHDVTYDKVKTGAEKDIQAMKEEIIKSKESMGELTAELTAKDEALQKFSNSLISERKLANETNEKFGQLTSDFNELEGKYNLLKSEYERLLANNQKQMLTSLVGSPIRSDAHGSNQGSKFHFGGENLIADEEKFYNGVKSVTGWGKKDK